MFCCFISSFVTLKSAWIESISLSGTTAVTVTVVYLTNQTLMSWRALQLFSRFGGKQKVDWALAVLPPRTVLHSFPYQHKKMRKTVCCLTTDKSLSTARWLCRMLVEYRSQTRSFMSQFSCRGLSSAHSCTRPEVKQRTQTCRTSLLDSFMSRVKWRRELLCALVIAETTSVQQWPAHTMAEQRGPGAYSVSMFAVTSIIIPSSKSPPNPKHRRPSSAPLMWRFTHFTAHTLPLTFFYFGPNIA